MLSLQDWALVALLGVGATAVMDVWLLLLRRLGVPTMNFALLGRWIGHGLRGRWVHATMARAQPVPAERGLGWLVHYLVGMAFAGVLVGLQGVGWLHSPRLWPALAFGIASAVLPLFVMQPAMGAGFASSRTPAPLKNSLRSLTNHAVFGAGLYLSAVAIGWLTR